MFPFLSIKSSDIHVWRGKTNTNQYKALLVLTNSNYAYSIVHECVMKDTCLIFFYVLLDRTKQYRHTLSNSHTLEESIRFCYTSVATLRCNKSVTKLKMPVLVSAPIHTNCHLEGTMAERSKANCLPCCDNKSSGGGR
jgi:hypothetical protein